METSAPKRRKTSPTSNVPASASDAPSSDGAGDGASSSPSTRTRRRRPSFASPTKASLARANPDILERRNAQRAQREASARADSRPRSDGSNDEDQLLTAQLEGASENRPGSDPADPDAETADMSGLHIAEPLSPIRRPIGGMGARPRRSLNKPSPRPLPPPAAQEEELLDPFKGRALRRSPPRGVLPVREHEEPELPPTPTQKGMVNPSDVNTSPMGIHNTPSRRPRRSRALADKLRSGSSPLKQPPTRPTDFDFEFAIDMPKKPPSELAPRQASRDTRGASTQAAASAKSEQRLRRSGRRQGKPHPARGVKEADPFAEKQELRDSLLGEVAQLEADLQIVRKENDRLYHAQRSHSRAPTLKESENTSAILDVLRRHALPPSKEEPPDPSQTWLTAALDPTSFLPFGDASVSVPNPFQLPDEKQEDQTPPVSHHPISMSGEEELPLLQLFTPLIFSSITTLLPQDANDEDPGPLMQQHSISVSSTPGGLFAARIEMLVNTKTLAISELAVPKLDPASAAELGPFVQGTLDAEAGAPRPPVGALKRNLSVLTWAMAEWTRLASKRARLWCRATRELGTPEGIAACVERLRASNKRRRRGGAGRRLVGDGGGEDDEDEDASDRERPGRRRKVGFGKADMLPLLGKTSLDLDLDPDGSRSGGLGVRVEWKIGFDWTGEGHSTIGVLVQAPGKWHARDDRGSLTGISELFDKLVQEGNEDPMEALTTVVALLVGDRMG